MYHIGTLVLSILAGVPACWRPGLGHDSSLCRHENVVEVGHLTSSTRPHPRLLVPQQQVLIAPVYLHLYLIAR